MVEKQVPLVGNVLTVNVLLDQIKNVYLNMPLTSIVTKNKEGQEQYIQFFTVPQEDKVLVTMFLCYDTWKPFAEFESFERDQTEEEYHRELRKAAMEHLEFVQEYSTNPEWTPGYTEPEENPDGKL